MELITLCLPPPPLVGFGLALEAVCPLKALLIADPASSLNEMMV